MQVHECIVITSDMDELAPPHFNSTCGRLNDVKEQFNFTEIK